MRLVPTSSISSSTISAAPMWDSWAAKTSARRTSTSSRKEGAVLGFLLRPAGLLAHARGAADRTLRHAHRRLYGRAARCAVGTAAGGTHAAAGAARGGLHDGDLRQVASRRVPAGIHADAARLRSSIRPHVRRARLLHPHPRRQTRLVSRRQALQEEGYSTHLDREGSLPHHPRASRPTSRSSSTCRSTASTRRIRCRTSYTKPYANLSGVRPHDRRHALRGGRGHRADHRRAR